MKLLKTIARWKTYLDRARSYIGYFQFAAMLLVMLKVYDDTTWGMWLFAHKLLLLLFIVLLFCVLIIIGYVDKLYVRPLEQEEYIITNPRWMDLYNKVIDLHTEIIKKTK